MPMERASFGCGSVSYERSSRASLSDDPKEVGGEAPRRDRQAGLHSDRDYHFIAVSSNASALCFVGK